MKQYGKIIRIPELCSFLGVSESTLFRWRRDGTGPQFFKEGRNIFYNSSDLKMWIRSLTTDGYN
jgi:predicted DNA-binding transcriptional regulator AlpA